MSPFPFQLLLLLRLYCLSATTPIMAGELFNSILSTPARLFRSASGRSPQTLSDPDGSSPSVAHDLFATPSSFPLRPRRRGAFPLFSFIAMISA